MGRAVVEGGKLEGRTFGRPSSLQRQRGLESGEQGAGRRGESEVDKYTEYAQELNSALRQAALRIGGQAVKFVEVEGEEPYFASDKTLEQAIVPVSIAAWKIVEISRSAEEGKKFRRVGIREVEREAGTCGQAGGIKMELEESGTGSRYDVAEVKIHWAGMPFVRDGGKSFRYDTTGRKGSLLKLKHWLGQRIFCVQTEIDTEIGGLLYAKVPEANGIPYEPPRGEVVEHTYTVIDLLECYRHDVAAHSGVKEVTDHTSKRGTLRSLLKSGLWAFRMYTRGLEIGLAQDLLMGIITSGPKAHKIQKVLAGQMEATNLKFEMSKAVIGLPENRGELVPKLLKVGK